MRRAPSDRNAGRERLGDLASCAAFVACELEDDNGTVYGSIGRNDATDLLDSDHARKSGVVLSHQC